MSRKRPRRSSPALAASCGFSIFRPIPRIETPMNWSGSISKPTRWDVPPSPASTISRRRWNRQCCPCSAPPKKCDPSSRSLLSNTPPERLPTYVLINSVAALRHLTDQDLKDIGVLLGHRRIMLAAIGELGSPGVAQPVTAELKPQDTAERR